MLQSSISIDVIEDHLGAADDRAAWEAILAVIVGEFEERYRDHARAKESWFMQIGACSHWWRPHQARWTAAGGFAYAVGYPGSAHPWPGLPDFDWSVTLAFDGREWKRVGKTSGHKQIVLRVAVPSRTSRHKQAAVAAMWSMSHEPTLYGFRNLEGKWVCVVASDEKEHGKILTRRELQEKRMI